MWIGGLEGVHWDSYHLRAGYHVQDGCAGAGAVLPKDEPQDEAHHLDQEKDSTALILEGKLNGVHLSIAQVLSRM